MAGPAPQTVAFAIGGAMARSELPAFAERVAVLLESTEAKLALCEVSALAPDAVSIDALARLQLSARRQSCRARLCGASNQLLELLELVGLREIVGG